MGVLIVWAFSFWSVNSFSFGPCTRLVQPCAISTKRILF